MFWSGETLKQRLPALSSDFNEQAVDCNAWTLTIGERVFITPTTRAALPDSHTIRLLSDGEDFQVPAGQFAFLQTKERIRVPPDAMAFISIKATIKLQGLVNISGFHVDPGFDGVLVFTVFNAGPTPIHLRCGQPCFLIWFASLDKTSKMVKTRASQRTVDGHLVKGMSGKLQSLEDFSERLNSLESTAQMLKIGGSIGATLVIGLLVAMVTVLVSGSSGEKAATVPVQINYPPVITMPAAPPAPTENPISPEQTVPEVERSTPQSLPENDGPLIPAQASEGDKSAPEPSAQARPPIGCSSASGDGGSVQPPCPPPAAQGTGDHGQGRGTAANGGL